MTKTNFLVKIKSSSSIFIFVLHKITQELSQNDNLFIKFTLSLGFLGLLCRYNPLPVIMDEIV